MHKNSCWIGCWLVVAISVAAEADPPIEVVKIRPLKKASFQTPVNSQKQLPVRQQGGNARNTNGVLLFDGAQDGNRQVDPQIAVGVKHVLHGTNTGLLVYDKTGNCVAGVRQSCFNGGIDPKLFYDPHNQVYGFNLWNPWDAEKLKPANIAISTSSDPTLSWRILPVPIPQGVDGGGIGYSRQFIGYTYPGGDRQSFVIETKEALSQDEVQVYFFGENLGHPVQTQDAIDALYFFKITRNHYVLNRVQKTDGKIEFNQVFRVPHNLEYFGWPPASPQKGTDKKTASGDRNPKNVVVQNEHIWFSHTVNCKGRAAVQWHQLDLTGTTIQSGLISSETSSYIQTTIAVNKRGDVLVGFQETSQDMYISPRLAYRQASDPLGTLRPMISLGEGLAATEGGAWGDYSGSVVDGENLSDLWTIQSIANERGRGSTVIARIQAE